MFQINLRAITLGKWNLVLLWAEFLSTIPKHIKYFNNKILVKFGSFNNYAIYETLKKIEKKEKFIKMTRSFKRFEIYLLCLLHVFVALACLWDSENSCPTSHSLLLRFNNAGLLFFFLNFPSLSCLRASVLAIFLLTFSSQICSWLTSCHHWAWIKCDTSTPHPMTAIGLIRQKRFSVALTCFLVFMELIIIWISLACLLPSVSLTPQSSNPTYMEYRPMKQWTINSLSRKILSK